MEEVVYLGWFFGCLFANLGAFLIPYIVMLLIGGLPMFYMVGVKLKLNFLFGCKLNAPIFNTKFRRFCLF